ncbi:MAG: zinc/manganese transporter permease [Rhodospirillaceae bacterium]|nr:zinc/manganese transporter permease [Rhodospirillaceae bacterium]|tara:strand:- start:115 stop:864 length:750 start_codon:yes stop_codon:yes gene_type:complete
MISIVGPAFSVGLMVSLVHAPLGIEVLRRGIIFIDLAVAQIAGLGLVIASIFLTEASFFVTQAIALSCALLAGLLFSKTEVLAPAQQEALIGASFVLAASLAILFLYDRPSGGQEIQHLLSGQMLFVTWREIGLHAPLYALILLIWFTKPAFRNGIKFYLIFAIAITSSVQMVGVYVVFASLILPALAALNTQHPHAIAWACGLLSVITGSITSIVLDAPSGPVTVVSYVTITLLAVTMRNMKTETKTH